MTVTTAARGFGACVALLLAGCGQPAVTHGEGEKRVLLDGTVLLMHYQDLAAPEVIADGLTSAPPPPAVVLGRADGAPATGGDRALMRRAADRLCGPPHPRQIIAVTTADNRSLWAVTPPDGCLP